MSNQDNKTTVTSEEWDAFVITVHDYKHALLVDFKSASVAWERLVTLYHNHVDAGYREGYQDGIRGDNPEIPIKEES